MDFAGAATLIASVACLLLALQWGGTSYPWRSSRIVGLLIGFTFLMVAFWFLQWKLGDRATIPIKVLLQRSILMSSVFSFFIHMSNYLVSFLFCTSHTLRLLTEDTGWVLSTFLLPSCTGCFSIDEWCKVHRSCTSGGRGYRNHGGSRDQNRTLRRFRPPTQAEPRC